MSTYYGPGWLYFYEHDTDSWSEVINHARTLAHMNWARGLGKLRGLDVEFERTLCTPLYRKPPAFSSLYSWAASPYTSSDPAPWTLGDPSVLDDALGLWITDWTGLDGTPITRSSTAAYPKGAVPNRLGQAARVMKVNVNLLAASELALEAMKDWLTNTLLGLGHSSQERSMWVWTSCPDGYSGLDSFWELRNVFCMEAPVWVDMGAQQSLGCFVRTVSFTLGAMEPCFYGSPVNYGTSAANFGSVDLASCDQGGHTLTMESLLGCPDPYTGSGAYVGRIDSYGGDYRYSVAPVVTLDMHYGSGGTDDSPPVRIRGLADGGAYTGLINPATSALGYDANWAHTVGFIDIAKVPYNSKVKIDCAQQRVTWLPGSPYPMSGVWQDGSHLIAWSNKDDDNTVATSAGFVPRRFPSYPAGYTSTPAVSVEPLFLADTLNDLKVTVDWVKTSGCG